MIGRAGALLVLVILAGVLLVLGYGAFPSILPWWMWIAALLSAVVAAVLYGGRRPEAVLPAVVSFTFVALLVEYLLLILVLGPRLR